MKSVLFNHRHIDEMDWEDVVREAKYLAAYAYGCPCYNGEPSSDKEFRALLKYIRQMSPTGDSEKNR